MDSAKSKVTNLKIKASGVPSGSPKKAVTGLKAKSATITAFSGGKKTLKAKSK